MSFLVKSPKLPGIAANQQPQVSSYKQAEPVPLGFGKQVLGAHWLSDAFNWREAAAGKNEPNFQYCSIAFGLGSGPINYVGRLKQDGKAMWDFNYTFSGGEDYHDFTINAGTALGQPWTVRIYRGTETQTADAYLVAGTGQNHPAYRGEAYAVMKNIDLGKGTTTVSTFAIETGRNAPALGADNGVGSTYGVNPAAAIYGLLTEARGGDFDADLLDATHWGTQADALWTTGVHARTGDMTFCHPWFSQATNLADAISQILAYFDGYIYAQAGQLRIGWFPGGAPGGSLPEIAEADLEQKPSGGGFPDWNQAATSVVVVFTDADDRAYEDGSATYQAPANRETGVAAAPARRDRPFVHRADQAQKIATELSVGDVDDSGVSLQVLKSRAVRLDGTPLVPGDLVTWLYGPHGLDLACRVVARRIRAGAASDMLEVIRERGAFPHPYAPTVDARAPYVAVPPVDVANYRLWFLPPGFGGGRQITCLVDRPAAQNIATKLHLSAGGAAPWEEILTLRSFAAKGTVHTGGVTSGASTVRIDSTSLDLVRLQAQSTLAQLDDTLLLLIDDELCSVSTIAVVSAGVYDLGILRGRQGSIAAAHAGAAAAWLSYYDELQPTTHSEFYEVRAAGVYDAGTATKHFKLQAISADATNDPLPNDPGISFTLPDLSDTDSAGVRTFRGPTAPVGDLRVGDLWYDTANGNKPHRWDGTAWVDISDTRFDTTTAVIDGIARDMAQMIATVNDHANAVIQELTQRQVTIAAEASTRAAAIIAEASSRTSADSVLQGNINTTAASITTEASTRASADSAETSARTSADSVLQGNINTTAASVTSEASTRASADSAETSARTSADSVLQGNINTAVASISSEASTRASADSAETSARTTADSTLQTNINTVSSGLTTEQTTRATAVSALASDIAQMIAIFNDNVAALAQEFSVRVTAISSETTARTTQDSTLQTNINTVSSSVTTEASTRSSADSAMASSITTLNSSVGTLNSSVSLLAAAYIVGGHAVAIAGWVLDVNGHATSLKLITDSGPTTVSALVLSGCDMMTSNYAESSGVPTTGWKAEYGGVFRAKGAIFRDADIIGTLRVGTIIESGVIVPVAYAPLPQITNPGTPNLTVNAPTGGAPTGYTLAYRIAAGTTQYATSFPFTITTGGAAVVVIFEATATNKVSGGSWATSWNDLFL